MESHDKWTISDSCLRLDLLLRPALYRQCHRKPVLRVLLITAQGGYGNGHVLPARTSLPAGNLNVVGRERSSLEVSMT